MQLDIFYSLEKNEDKSESVLVNASLYNTDKHE